METSIDPHTSERSELIELVLSDSGDVNSLESSSSAALRVSHSPRGASPLPPSYHDSSSAQESLADRMPEAAPEVVTWTEDTNVNKPEDPSLMDTSLADEETRQEDDAPPLQATDEYSAVDSFNSSRSTMTELSDVSSLPPSTSSKSTTPAETDVARRHQGDDQTLPFTPPSYSCSADRLTFTVLPKSSVPADIPSYQYAAECIIAAETSRLNPYALHAEEYHLLRQHISHNQVTTYLNIRNGILRLWTRRPWIAVTRREAVGCANARWFDAASVCYDWLVRRAFINFGCTQLPERAANGHSDAPEAKRRKVVAVVGAGISGLACARQLEGLFNVYSDHFYDIGEDIPKVVVLEGRGRVGGRVYSREFKSKPGGEQLDFDGKRHTAEMGGMIITGFDRGNPMNVLVRGQLGLPYHTLSAETTIYDSNGKPVDAVRDELVEKLYNDCLDRVSEFKYKTQPPRVVEGNRGLLDAGRDSVGDGSKSIAQAEKASIALPHVSSASVHNAAGNVGLFPMSADKLTGRVHNELGVSGALKSTEKAKRMGWQLKPGAQHESEVDLGDGAALKDATLGSVLDLAIEQYKKLVDLNSQDHRLINWHIANLEYSNATNVNHLSLGLWDIDAGNEWEGHHTMVGGGYQSVARGLLHCPSLLDLTTKFPVKKIQYHSDDFLGPAKIESEDGVVVEADCVVCTVPLGVLKHGSIDFEPPLPAWKTSAIDRLGFGILNKVVLVYDKVFWEEDRHIFGVLRDAPDRHSTSQREYRSNRGRFFQWFNVSSTTGLPCLIALMAGDAGFETEHASNECLIAEATSILRGLFGQDVPYPVESVVTRWGADRFARGSYSSAAPGMLPEDYDTTARSIGNLFFAGEHTIVTHPATVHGAYLSGLRAASEVLEAMVGPIEVPTPLVLPRDSLLLHRRKEAAKDPEQARLDAYEVQVWGYIHSQIGERPVRPCKVTGNPYLLYSKAHFEDARSRCEENRKSTKSRGTPKEVRMMTAKMWKHATAEERRPFEEQAAEHKRMYAEAIQQFTESSQAWDSKAASLLTIYEKDHPIVPGPDEMRRGNDIPSMFQKYRRAKHVSYAEEQDNNMEL
ncbi:hypothetical protein RJ55_01393 [Drechmeria coniospora]|nr:hypothetical protein RJ55_01393 [Drechmeria coniospora]